MKRTGRWVWILGLAALTVAAFGASSEKPKATGFGDEKAKAGSVRVGVYESRAVALAFGRSDLQRAKYEGLRKALEQAKAAGDEKRAEEIEAEGPRGQDLMHRQVFGDAPIPNVIEAIRDEMPRVAKEAKVDLIVTGIVHAGPGVEVVDLTEPLVRLFNPTKETLKMALEIKEHPPLEWHKFPIDD